MDFREVMEIADEVCRAHEICIRGDDGKPCKFMGDDGKCVVQVGRKFDFDKAEKIAEAIKEEKEKYPTWQEYFNELFPHGSKRVSMCPVWIYEDWGAVCEEIDCNKCKSMRIPEGIAKMLGIEPKER